MGSQSHGRAPLSEAELAAVVVGEQPEEYGFLACLSGRRGLPKGHPIWIPRLQPPATLGRPTTVGREVGAAVIDWWTLPCAPGKQLPLRSPTTLGSSTSNWTIKVSSKRR